MVFFEFEIFIINLLKRKFSFPVILWYPTISGIGFIVLEKFLTAIMENLVRNICFIENKKI